MMKKITFPLNLLCALIFFTGCTHYYYAPNAANIPMFKEKNTFKAKLGYSWDDYNGGDFQMAYSVSKNIGVMVNAFSAGKHEQVQNYGTSVSHEESGMGSLIEIGGGYYKPFGEKKIWIFETYAGVGFGGETHTYGSSETANLHLTKFFVQPSIAYSSKRGHFQAGLSSRFATLNLKVKNSNVTFDVNQNEKNSLNEIVSHPFSFLWEPSLIMGIGGEDLKFYAQITPSYNLNNSYLMMDHENISFGIKMTIKKNQKKVNTDSDYMPPHVN